MKLRLIVFFLMISGGNLMAQVNFEPGYFIDVNGKRVSGLIKNQDWKDNPDEFEFKSSETATVQTMSLGEIQEFGIDGFSKYIRASVKMDRTSKDVNEIDENSDPVFNDELLFLKVLVEGEASLYEYVESNLIRYFLQMKGKEIEQLVYKKYKDGDDVIRYNESYKQQLWRNLYCTDITQEELQRVSYTQRSLIKYLGKYAACKNVDLENYQENAKGDLKQYRLTIRPGVIFSSLTAGNPNLGNFVTNEYEYESKVGFRIGIENEYIFAFNKNKWSLIVEPTYQAYSTEEVVNSETVSVDYSSIEIPIGLRYYMYLNENHRIFVNAALAFDIALNKELIYFNNNEFETKTGPYFALGAGYSLNNKIDVEARYNFDRDLLSDFLGWEANYGTFVFTVGYSIF